ncbi:MAG: lysophospholipid acyltransferase family protein [Candidatus Eisenbacteria bacterium]
MPKRRRRAGPAKRMQHLLEYLLVRGALLLFAVLPLRANLWLARRLGDFAFDVVRLRRRVTLDNLRRMLGDGASRAQLLRVARATYRTMAMTFVELTLFDRQDLRQLGGRLHFVGLEHVARASEMGRGMIYLTGHVGNWEICAAATALIDAPLSIVFADQRNPYVNRMVRRARERMELNLIPVGYALRAMLRTVREGGRIGFAGDQDAGRDGIAVSFMGHPASTATGAARIAYRSGAPVVICFDRHTGHGFHEIEYFPPLLAERGRPEPEEVRRILTHYMGRLEDFVRRHPEQYFWMHRRWKTTLSAEGENRNALAEFR